MGGIEILEEFVEDVDFLFWGLGINYGGLVLGGERWDGMLGAVKGG